jgi:hypothetical protein
MRYAASRPAPLCLALVAGLALAAGLTAGGEKAGGDLEARHAQEVEAWRQDRLERLRQPDGWLSLVGLAWLEEGVNACGSDPANAVPLPAPAPPRAGVFVRRGDQVTFVAAPGSAVTHQGQPVERLPLVADADGAPTVLELGTINFHVIRRGERLGVRSKDSQSPVRAAFEGIDHYPVSREWRVEGRFEPYEPPKPVPVPNVLGTVDDELSPGAVVFAAAGRTLRLDVLEGADEDEVFVIFGDATNGEETYGGGRFLYADLSPGGLVVLDFNRAYNPPCAFTLFATCPLPPKQNRLPLAVRAGEKKYGEGHH